MLDRLGEYVESRCCTRATADVYIHYAAKKPDARPPLARPPRAAAGPGLWAGAAKYTGVNGYWNRCFTLRECQEGWIIWLLISLYQADRTQAEAARRQER
ncbi:MAG: hypothetical protein RJR37_14205 [Peptococcaceae bacterium MAG4]|nr:hypothetical protein [Peptococcaceae bacterium MAG4]